MFGRRLSIYFAGLLGVFVFSLVLFSEVRAGDDTIRILKDGLAHRLPGRLARAWNGVEMELHSFDPGKDGWCVRYSPRGVLQISSKCVNSELLSSFKRSRYLDPGTRLGWHVYLMAVRRWSMRDPLFVDQAVREEVVTQDWYRTPIALGLSLDQPVDDTYREFWTRAIAWSVQDPMAVIHNPTLAAFLARRFYGGGDQPYAMTDADMVRVEVRAEGLVAKVRIVTEPKDAWLARYHILRKARGSIRAGYFIKDKNDPQVRAFYGLLLRKARDNVKVSLLVDGRTYWRGGDDVLQELVAAGVKVHVYNPILNGAFSILGSSTAYRQNFLLVDDQYFMTGSRGMETDKPGTRHLDVVAEFFEMPIPLVQAFNTEFYSNVTKRVLGESFGNWSSPADDLLEAIKAFEVRDEKVYRNYDLFGELARYYPVQILDNSSRFGTRTALTDKLLSLIDQANQEILIQNPSLTLSPKALEHLAAAAVHGAKIRFQVSAPKAHENLQSEVQREILGSEVIIPADRTQIEARAVVFDHQSTIIGGYDLGTPSRRRDSELALFVNSMYFAAELEAQIRQFVVAKAAGSSVVSGR